MITFPRKKNIPYVEISTEREYNMDKPLQTMIHLLLGIPVVMNQTWRETRACTARVAFEHFQFQGQVKGLFSRTMHVKLAGQEACNHPPWCLSHSNKNNRADETIYIYFFGRTKPVTWNLIKLGLRLDDVTNACLFHKKPLTNHPANWNKENHKVGFKRFSY